MWFRYRLDTFISFTATEAFHRQKWTSLHGVAAWFGTDSTADGGRTDGRTHRGPVSVEAYAIFGFKPCSKWGGVIYRGKKILLHFYAFQVILDRKFFLHKYFFGNIFRQNVEIYFYEKKKFSIQNHLKCLKKQ